jgi:mannitol/fructose-specific phosphotransferase system IIA component (Ntr-type)
MRIIELLQEDRVKVFLDQRGKDGVLGELVDLAMAGRPEGERAAALRAVYEREAVASTGIGHGVAVPHAKIPNGDGLLVAFGLAREPVSFDAIDGEPVRLFFLVLCPQGEAGLQLRFLARLSRLMHNESLRGRLVECSGASEALDALREYETHHFG